MPIPLTPTQIQQASAMQQAANAAQALRRSLNQPSLVDVMLAGVRNESDLGSYAGATDMDRTTFIRLLAEVGALAKEEQLLGGANWRSGSGQPAKPKPADAAPAGGKLSKEGKALAALVDHPDWTNSQIATAAGCHVKTLNNFKKFNSAKKAMKAGKDNLPTGRKNRDGGIEAWDKR